MQRVMIQAVRPLKSSNMLAEGRAIESCEVVVCLLDWKLFLEYKTTGKCGVCGELGRRKILAYISFTSMTYSLNIENCDHVIEVCESNTTGLISDYPITRRRTFKPTEIHRSY